MERRLWKNGDQLIESARDGKETLTLARKINMLVRLIERYFVLTKVTLIFIFGQQW